MNPNNTNRRSALKMLLCGTVAVPVTAMVSGCGLIESLPAGQSGPRTDGQPLSLQVRDALISDPATANLIVQIATAGDEVVIKGYVPNQSDIYNIELVANAVPGVRHVLMDVYTQ